MTACNLPKSTAETLAALTARFHRHRGYAAFFERHAAKCGGIDSTWRFCIKAANSFDAAEGSVLLPDDYVWSTALNAYVASLLKLKQLPSEKELRAIARQAIRS